MRSGPPAPTARIRAASTWAAAVLFAVVFAMALHYVVHYGTRVAFVDDLTQSAAVQPDFPITADWLWSQHNEHRIPLARLFYLATVRGTHDFRTGTLLDLVILGLVAAGCMIAARRVRGHSRIADVFFPLVWLSWSHSENLLNSFQIALVLTSVLLVVVTLAILQSRPSAKSIAVVSVCACLLSLSSLCGGIDSVALSAWLVWMWWSFRRTTDAREVRAGKVALSGAVASLALFASTFIGYVFPPRSPTPAIDRALEVAAQFLASPLLWIEANLHVAPWVITAAVIVVGCLSLVRIARREPEERARCLGLVAVVLAVVVLALSIGVGRGGEDMFAGTRSRYVLLAVPWACAFFFAACMREPARIARTVQWSACGLAACAYLVSLGPGAQFGAERLRAAEALERDVARGRSYSELALDHWRDFFYGEDLFHTVLMHLDRAGFAPFERVRGPDPNLLVGADPYSANFRNTGTERSDFGPLVRRVEGQPMLIVGSRSVLEWPLPPDVSVVRGSFGVHPDTWKRGAVHFTVTVLDAHENVRAAFDRTLDPEHVESDRGFADFGLPFAPGPDQRLVVSTTGLASEDGRTGWGCWTQLRLR
jgi:hypothetical protein